MFVEERTMESAKELGEAIKRGDDCIEVEFDLAKKCSNLKRPGKQHGLFASQV